MNKKGKISKTGAIGIAFIFVGLIVSSEINLPAGIIMVGIGIYLVLRD